MKKIIIYSFILLALASYISIEDPNSICLEDGKTAIYGKSVATVTGGDVCLDINDDSVYIPLGTNLKVDVIVLNWEPQYFHPHPTAETDHLSSDIYKIYPYRLDGNTKIPQGQVGDANPKYPPRFFTRGEELPFTDPHANTWREKFGDRWMLFGVFPGYVGINPGTYTWEVVNERTNKTWEVLRIVQRGYIDCENLVDGKCVGVVDDVPLMPPMPPKIFFAEDTTGTFIIDRAGWTVEVDDIEQSTTTKAELYDKAHAIDEDVTTIWHTKWTDPPVPMPHWIIVDMKTEHNVSSMIITPRPYDPAKAHTVNSNVKDYKLSVSTDNITWNTVKEGTLTFTEGGAQEVQFTPTNARYIKLDVFSASGDTPAVCLGDLKFMEIL